jgi:hypothetical protein
MKLPLRITFAASLLLNGLLAWVLTHQPGSQPAAAAASPSPLVKALVTHEEPPPAAPFDWKQLEAPDFATYIANLRRIGCPEHAIRSLIEPELHQVITAQPPQGGTSPGSAATGRQVADLMQQLLAPAAAAAPASQPVTGDEAAVSTTTSPVSRPLSTPLSIPAAFAVGNAPDDPAITPEGISTTPSDATLTPETRQAISSMRQQFGQQVSSSGTQPSSSQYYKEWVKAQRLSDDTFAAMFGGDAFMRVQQEAKLKEALAAQQAASAAVK